jgi:hypothetical protein
VVRKVITHWKPVLHLPPVGEVDECRLAETTFGVRGVKHQQIRTPTRRLASLVGDLPHKGEVMGDWYLVITYLKLNK